MKLVQDITHISRNGGIFSYGLVAYFLIIEKNKMAQSSYSGTFHWHGKDLNGTRDFFRSGAVPGQSGTAAHPYVGYIQVELCADFIVSVAACRSILVGGSGAPSVPKTRAA